jgi:uncharacterized Zn finger protein
MDDTSCPSCGSNNLAIQEVIEPQTQNTYTEYECFDCGETWDEEDE